jgi:hypothetical protein
MGENDEFMKANLEYAYNQQVEESKKYRKEANWKVLEDAKKP